MKLHRRGPNGHPHQGCRPGVVGPVSDLRGVFATILDIKTRHAEPIEVRILDVDVVVIIAQSPRIAPLQVDNESLTVVDENVEPVIFPWSRVEIVKLRTGWTPLPLVVLLRLITGSAHVDHAGTHRVRGRVGDRPILKHRLVEPAQVIDDHIASLAYQPVDGTHHLRAGRRSRKVQFRTGGEIVYDFEHCRPFITAARTTGIDRD